MKRCVSLNNCLPLYNIFMTEVWFIEILSLQIFSFVSRPRKMVRPKSFWVILVWRSTTTLRFPIRMRELLHIWLQSSGEVIRRRPATYIRWVLCSINCVWVHLHLPGCCPGNQASSTVLYHHLSWIMWSCVLSRVIPHSVLPVSLSFARPWKRLQNK